MTFAWYAHLKNLSQRPWYIAALVSWGIALFEYLLQVPANRIGYSELSLPQPATASPTPGAGCFSQATPCQGRTGCVGCGRGALVLALTGVAYLGNRTGGSIVSKKSCLDEENSVR